MEGIIRIDITELLDSLAESLEGTSQKLVREAIKEIKDLRKSVKFHIDESEERNRARLLWMDKYRVIGDILEETLADIRREYDDEYACSWCKQNLYDDAGKYLECDGFHKKDCFQLDGKKLSSEVKRRVAKGD